MENLPAYINIIFLLTVLLTLLIFYRAANNSKTFVAVIVPWMLLQALLSYQGLYTKSAVVPPLFILAVVPPLLFIATLFLFSAGRRFIDSLQLDSLTLLHIIRIPVEIVLFCLYVQKIIPRVMTFEGHNYDILSGLTAPFIYYLVFIRSVPRKYLLLWNIFCLVLLLNIVVTAILSAPFSFQQLGFEQPNIAILHFPFMWLPSCIVPLVLFSHLAALRRIILTQKKNTAGVPVKS